MDDIAVNSFFLDSPPSSEGLSHCHQEKTIASVENAAPWTAHAISAQGLSAAADAAVTTQRAKATACGGDSEAVAAAKRDPKPRGRGPRARSTNAAPLLTAWLPARAAAVRAAAAIAAVAAREADDGFPFNIAAAPPQCDPRGNGGDVVCGQGSRGCHAAGTGLTDTEDEHSGDACSDGGASAGAGAGLGEKRKRGRKCGAGKAPGHEPRRPADITAGRRVAKRVCTGAAPAKPQGGGAALAVPGPAAAAAAGAAADAGAAAASPFGDDDACVAVAAEAVSTAEPQGAGQLVHGLCAAPPVVPTAEAAEGRQRKGRGGRRRAARSAADGAAADSDAGADGGACGVGRADGRRCAECGAECSPAWHRHRVSPELRTCNACLMRWYRTGSYERDAAGRSGRRGRPVGQLRLPASAAAGEVAGDADAASADHGRRDLTEVLPSYRLRAAGAAAVVLPTGDDCFDPFDDPFVGDDGGFGDDTDAGSGDDSDGQATDSQIGGQARGGDDSPARSADAVEAAAEEASPPALPHARQVAAAANAVNAVNAAAAAAAPAQQRSAAARPLAATLVRRAASAVRRRSTAAEQSRGELQLDAAAAADGDVAVKRRQPAQGGADGAGADGDAQYDTQVHAALPPASPPARRLPLHPPSPDGGIDALQDAAAEARTAAAAAAAVAAAAEGQEHDEVISPLRAHPSDAPVLADACNPDGGGGNGGGGDGTAAAADPWSTLEGSLVVFRSMLDAACQALMALEDRHGMLLFQPSFDDGGGGGGDGGGGGGAAPVPAAAAPAAAVRTAKRSAYERLCGGDAELRARHLSDIIMRWLQVSAWQCPLLRIMGPAVAHLGIDRPGPLGHFDAQQQTDWDDSRRILYSSFLAVAAAAVAEFAVAAAPPEPAAAAVEAIAALAAARADPRVTAAAVSAFHAAADAVAAGLATEFLCLPPPLPHPTAAAVAVRLLRDPERAAALYGTAAAAEYAYSAASLHIRALAAAALRLALRVGAAPGRLVLHLPSPGDSVDLAAAAAVAAAVPPAGQAADGGCYRACRPMAVREWLTSARGGGEAGNGAGGGGTAAPAAGTASWRCHANLLHQLYEAEGLSATAAPAPAGGADGAASAAAANAGGGARSVGEGVVVWVTDPGVVDRRALGTPHVPVVAAAVVGCGRQGD